MLLMLFLICRFSWDVPELCALLLPSAGCTAELPVARVHALPKHPPLLCGRRSDTTGKEMEIRRCSYLVEHKWEGECIKFLSLNI